MQRYIKHSSHRSHFKTCWSTANSRDQVECDAKSVFWNISSPIMWIAVEMTEYHKKNNIDHKMENRIWRQSMQLILPYKIMTKKAPLREFLGIASLHLYFELDSLAKKERKQIQLKGWIWLLALFITFFFFFYRYFDNIIIVNSFGHNNYKGNKIN